MKNRGNFQKQEWPSVRIDQETQSRSNCVLVKGEREAGVINRDSN